MDDTVQTIAKSRRRQDWPRYLADYLCVAAKKPFTWGEHDCCLYACGAIEALTGLDVAAPFRGLYGDKATALRVLAKYNGVEGIAQMVAREHGFDEIPPLMAGRGDVVSVETLEAGVALAVVDLDGRSILAIAPAGPRHAPLQAARRAWRIA